MTLKCGTVVLKKLYDFANEHCNNPEAVRLKGSELGTQFCDLCDSVTAAVEEAQGFYLWGTYNEQRLWENIYLGMAGYGRSKNLKKRIREELKDERCCLWRSIYTRDALDVIRREIHQGKYQREWQRGMLKTGSTLVIWVSAAKIPAAQVENVERNLIERSIQGQTVGASPRQTRCNQRQRKFLAVFVNAFTRIGRVGLSSSQRAGFQLKSSSFAERRRTCSTHLMLLF